MKRYERRKLGVERLNLSSGKISMYDMFDDALKSAFYMNDDEYDYIAANLSDDELGIVVGASTISEFKKSIEVVDNCLSKYYESIR